MLNGTEIVRMAQALAEHSAQRQSEIARNVANADTPGYRAKDVMPFDQVYDSKTGPAPRTTRPGHMGGLEPETRASLVVDSRTEPSPNGNSVSLESEMVKTAEVQRSHGLALAVYKSSLDMMRAAIGRGR